LTLRGIGFLPAILLLGCGGDATNGPKIERSDDYFTAGVAGPVTLRLANVELSAQAELKRDGSTYTIEIVGDGEPIESEVYRVDKGAISAVRLGTGETADPPIPLMKFPMTVGDKFDWSGQIAVGDRTLQASAVVSSEISRPDLATGPVEAVHIHVELEISGGTQREANRRLDFWFAEGKGPVMRDYGNQVREPAGNN
jgi:hypothetical protein